MRNHNEDHFQRIDSDEIDIREFKEVTIDDIDFSADDTKYTYEEAWEEPEAETDLENENLENEYSENEDLENEDLENENLENENLENEDSDNGYEKDETKNSRIRNIIAISLGLVIFVLIFLIGKSLINKKSLQEGLLSSDRDSQSLEVLNFDDASSPESIVQQTTSDAYGDTAQTDIAVGSDQGNADQNTQGQESADAEDPQRQAVTENGAEAQITQETVQTGMGENSNISIGIDVAKYQGTIDWQQVAASGVQFAMIRAGYRTQADGVICEDPTAKYNMQEAVKYGIQIGVYFFSTAVNEAEAREEADWVADYIARYPITYPVAYNCEGYHNADNRQYSMDKTERTNAAIAFLERISQRGYTPMFYAAKSEMEGGRDWDISSISARYKVWVSQYPAAPFPETPASSYSAVHAMWQFTNHGKVPGITQNVDLNVAYFSYDNAAQAADGNTPDEVSANVEVLMNFTEVNETVTAKDVVNLRNIPSQGEDSSVLRTLKNGETAQRTGISDSGWSRLVIDGQNYYAVSSYLTTDTSYVTPQPDDNNNSQSEDGIRTQFTTVNESVTAKIEVNLRNLPSVTNPDAAVIAVLKNGEWITRTGISDNGWSRVEYNGQTLYCISSYLTTG